MRLIDADELKELIAANVYPICDVFNSRDYGMFWTGGIEKAIDEATTVVEIKYPITRVMVRGVEYIPVVRCKDCKYEQQCRKAVEYITHEPTSVTIEYKSVEFCSYGDGKERASDGLLQDAERSMRNL